MAHYDCKECGYPFHDCRCNKKPMSVHECSNVEQFYAEQSKTAPVKSDGGSSYYYQLELLVASSCVKEVEGYPEVKRLRLETGDIIRALVDNDFDLGNIIKACRRIHQAKKGTGKAGTDVEYDCKKIDYFLKEWYKAYQMEQL